MSQTPMSSRVRDMPIPFRPQTAAQRPSKPRKSESLEWDFSPDPRFYRDRTPEHDVATPIERRRWVTLAAARSTDMPEALRGHRTPSIRVTRGPPNRHVASLFHGPRTGRDGDRKTQRWFRRAPRAGSPRWRQGSGTCCPREVGGMPRPSFLTRPRVPVPRAGLRPWPQARKPSPP